MRSAIASAASTASRSTGGSPSAGRKAGSLDHALRFVLARSLCLLASSLLLTAALLVMPPLAAKVVSAVLTFALTYTLTRRLVFR
jgi:putative flippase GtrA